MGKILKAKASPKPSVARSSSEKARKRKMKWLRAGHLVAPPTLATTAILKMLGPSLEKAPVAAADLNEALLSMAIAVNKGMLNQIEGVLMTQATVLDVTFNLLLHHAADAGIHNPNYERLLRLGLRAQAQSARTLEILAEIKQGPRVMFAGQLNAANQQVINNNSPLPQEKGCSVRSAQKDQFLTHAATPAKPLNPTPENASLDSRNPPTTTRDHTGHTALAPLQWPSNGDREGAKQPKRGPRPGARHASIPGSHPA